MAFDRSKWKATSTATLKSQSDEVAKGGKTQNGKANYLKFVDGKNKLRLFPAHPGTESFSYPKKVHFLSVEVTYKKGDEEITETKRKPIFNAKVHGNLPNDPCDLYIDRVYEMARDKFNEGDYPDKAKRDAGWKEYTSKLGSRTGIKAGEKFTSYAKLINPEGETISRGIIDLAKTVKDSLNEIAMDADDVEGVITTDPFTDPEDGRIVTVKYDSKSTTPQGYYKVSIDLKGGTPLTDSDMEWLDEQKPLEEIYVGVYCQRDFDFAMEGLQKFDQESGYGVFESDEFLDDVEDLAKLVKPTPTKEDYEKKEKEAKEEVPAKKVEKKATKKVESKSLAAEDSDLPFDLELEDMDMEQLKGYIRRKELPIRIMARYSEEDVVEIIKEEEELLAANTTAIEKSFDDEPEEKEEKPTSRRSRRGSAALDALK